MRQHWFPIEKLCSKKAKVSFINTTLDTPQNSGKALFYNLFCSFVFVSLVIIIIICMYDMMVMITTQGGITCGTIDEPRKSSKAIDERVIIDFRDKNVIIARFSDKNGGFLFYR